MQGKTSHKKWLRSRHFCQLFLFIPVILCLSCRKEYQVAPVGNPIPYKDTLAGLTDYINADNQHDLFWSLWRKSDILKRLDSLKQGLDTARLSIFVPSNEALRAAGWDASRISAATSESVDSLVYFHTYSQQISPAALTDISNIFLTSFFNGSGKRNFLLFGGMYVGIGGGAAKTDPWFIFLGALNGDLLVNNKPVGRIADARPTRNVTIFNTAKLLQKPVMSTREWLYRDGRFTIYLGIRRYNDSVYNQQCRAPFSYTDAPYESHQFVAGLRQVSYYTALTYPVLDYLANEQHWYDSTRKTINTDKYIVSHTLFAPTDDAFHQAGFRDLNDVIAFDRRSQPTSVNIRTNYYTSFWVPSNYFPIDSVLNLHLFGFNPFPANGPLDLNGNRLSLNGLYPGLPVHFYSNIMRVGFLADYGAFLSSNTQLPNAGGNPLDFFTSGNTLRVRARGADYEAATVTTPDIETYNGIVQVVDRLFIPKGFQLIR